MSLRVQPFLVLLKCICVTELLSTLVTGVGIDVVVDKCMPIEIAWMVESLATIIADILPLPAMDTRHMLPQTVL